METTKMTAVYFPLDCACPDCLESPAVIEPIKSFLTHNIDKEKKIVVLKSDGVIIEIPMEQFVAIAKEIESYQV